MELEFEPGKNIAMKIPFVFMETFYDSKSLLEAVRTILRNLSLAIKCCG